MSQAGETQALPHVTVYRPSRGLLSPAVRYCLGCKFVTSGAEQAMKESAERHEASESGSPVLPTQETT